MSFFWGAHEGASGEGETRLTDAFRSLFRFAFRPWLLARVGQLTKGRATASSSSSSHCSLFLVSRFSVRFDPEATPSFFSRSRLDREQRSNRNQDRRGAVQVESSRTTGEGGGEGQSSSRLVSSHPRLRSELTCFASIRFRQTLYQGVSLGSSPSSDVRSR